MKPCDAWVAAELSCELMENTVLSQHKVRNAKRVWGLEGRLVKGWIRARRNRRREGIFTPPCCKWWLMGSITATLLLKGEGSAKKHHGPCPWQPATAGRGQDCPAGSSTDASWVPFHEVAALKATNEKPQGRTTWCRGWVIAGCCSTAAVTAQSRVKAGNHRVPVTRLVLSYRLGK